MTVDNMGLHDTIVVAINDSRLRFLVIQRLKDLRVDFVVRNPNDPICGVARSVLTDDASGTIPHLVGIESTDSIEDALIAALTLLRGIERPNTATIGIDPGMRFGLALLIDGAHILSSLALSPGDAARKTALWTSAIRKRFPYCSIVIRVGNGSRLFGALYLRSLKMIDNESPVELTDERNTTVNGADDCSSARLIALRGGVPVTDADMILEERDVYVRLLQKLFTKLTGSNGLSPRDAKRVIAGETSLLVLTRGRSSGKE